MTNTNQSNTSRASYSQYAMWEKCEYQWALKYKQKLPVLMKTNINLMSGIILHEAIQKWIDILFKDEQEASVFDPAKTMEDSFKQIFIENTVIVKDEENNTETLLYPCKKEEMIEHFSDIYSIFRYLQKNYKDIFSPNTHDFIGAEIPLNVSLHSDLKFSGYIDLVFVNRETKRILIIDIKVSKKGWNLKFVDKVKLHQLVLYKKFYSLINNIHPDNVDTIFLILARKVDYKRTFPASVIVVNTSIEDMDSALSQFHKFIDKCYLTDLEPTSNNFPPTPTKFNCTYCDFADSCEFNINKEQE